MLPRAGCCRHDFAGRCIVGRQESAWIQSLVGGALILLAALVPAVARGDDTHSGATAGLTAEGHPFQGDPNAQVVIEEFSDFLCPYCARHHNQTLSTLVEKYVRSGKVRYVFRDFPIAALHPTAEKGHIAAGCVAEQGAAHFWLMHDELFRTQKEWSRLPDPAEFLASAARKSGADIAAYQKCVASGKRAEAIKKTIEEGKTGGLTGTPSFVFKVAGKDKRYNLIGAQPIDRFAEWTDQLLAGKEPPQPKPPERPFWAKPEGLKPDPKRPGYTAAGDPFRGDPQARLAVVEFDDFQCPSCRRHALETQPALDKEFVDTGRVLWVVKQLPLRMHPHAPAAATAAECAADQGKFWEMRRLLYEEQDEWTTGDTDRKLVALANRLGLKEAPFEACFSGRKALERVLSDIYDAQESGVQTAPTFVLIHGDKGTVLRGTKPAEAFASTVRQLLGAAKAEKPQPTGASQ